MRGAYAKPQLVAFGSMTAVTRKSGDLADFLGPEPDRGQGQCAQFWCDLFPFLDCCQN